MKKIISLLLSLSIVSSIVFSSTYVSAENVLSADADGVLWIEESDYDTYSNATEGVLSTRVGTNGTTQELADSMSGGDAYWAWWSGVIYSATYKVNVAEARTYKLWYRGSDPTGSYHNKSKITVNGTEVPVTKVAGTEFTATVDPSGTKKNFSCAWFVAEVNLVSGVNTIGYNVTEKASSGQKYACLFDCMVLAPSNYGWGTPSNSSRPKKEVIELDKNGVTWIEESDYATYSNATEGVLSTRVGINGTPQSLADSMSGGDAYWAWWSGVTYTSTYKVDAAEAGTYKLWYRGSDPTGSYHNKSKITVNGEEVAISKISGTDFTATIDPSGTKKNFACAWFVAEVSLAEGVNTIGYNVTEKASSGSKYACLFDCMVIAPALYTWKKPTISTSPEISLYFSLEGSMELGSNSVNATVTLNDRVGDIDAVVITALYDADNTLKYFKETSNTFTDDKPSVDVNLELPADVTAGDTLRVFLWDSIKGMNPLSSTLALTVDSVTGNIVEFEEDGVCWIEETDFYEALSGTETTGDTYSDGAASYAWFTSSKYHTTYKVNVSEAGTYKLWYRGSDPENPYHDKSKIYVNGTEAELTKVTNTTFSAKVENNRRLSCAWFIAEVTLNAGINTIEYQIKETSTNGNRYAGLFDCMVIAPSSYKWARPSNTTRPLPQVVGEDKLIEFADDGVCWIEDSEFSMFDSGTNELVTEVTDATMSGGKAQYSFFTSRVHHTTYKVNAETAGTYKLWYRGSDPGSANHDKSKILVNGEEVAVTKIKGTDFTAKVEEGKNVACAWFVAEVELNSGENVIEYKITETSTSEVLGQYRYVGLLDCFVLAPTAYEWTAPTISTRPAEPEVGPEGKTVEFDADGTAWIEESDYYEYSNAAEGVLSTRVGTNGTTQETADSMSGGDAYWAWWGGVTYTSSYKVNAPEAGTYKLWYRGSDPTGQYHDSVKITVNGEEVTVSKIKGTDFTAAIDPSGTKKNFACAWFVADVTLEAGVNTIGYDVTEVSTKGKYACLFDCMVVAPATYVWETPTVDTKPEVYVEPEIGVKFDEDGVCWIEESDYDTYSNASDGVLSTRVGKNGTTQATADMMSGGDAYWAWWGGVTYTSSYKVNAPEAGTYKLWYRGSDPTGQYHDSVKITVNGEEVTVSKISGTDFTATIDPSGTKKNFACAWFVVEVTLEKGVNTIGYDVTEVSTKGKYACLFDCMVVAPSTYVWATPTISTKPTAE